MRPPPPFERRLIVNGQSNVFGPVAVHSRDGAVADCTGKFRTTG
jgi:hypothetical protein